MFGNRAKSKTEAGRNLVVAPAVVKLERKRAGLVETNVQRGHTAGEAVAHGRGCVGEPLLVENSMNAAVLDARLLRRRSPYSLKPRVDLI